MTSHSHPGRQPPHDGCLHDDPLQHKVLSAPTERPHVPVSEKQDRALLSAVFANVAETLAGIGVNFTIRLTGNVGESLRGGDDPANLPEAQVARRKAYGAHINSPAWRTGARLAELEASGFRCRICNRPAGEVRLEVHHRTYENFGCELIGDLTTLCSDCHVVNTDMLRRRRYIDFVPVSADVTGAERAPLFDPMRPGEMS